MHIGDMVYVEKGGQIIPKIVGVDKNARIMIGDKVKFITCLVYTSVFISSYLKRRSVEIEPKASEMMAEFVGADLSLSLIHIW